MPVQKLPPWGEDQLSAFFRTAEANDRVTSLKLSSIYSLLQRVDAAFRHVDEAVEKDSRQEPLVPRFLIARTHSSFLASIRLAISGQIPESYAILRAGIQQAGRPPLSFRSMAGIPYDLQLPNDWRL